MDRHDAVPVEFPGVRSRARTFFEMLKTWMLCGWISRKTFLKPGYVEVVSRGASLNRPQAAERGPYVKPSSWTQLVRKCRARFRSSCYTHPHQQPDEQFYQMESYERNFDRGREYWEDFPIIGHSLQDDYEWKNKSSDIPDPVWMITATQEEMKEKAAAIAKAKRGEI